MGKKQTTVAFTPEMTEAIKAEAARNGIPWTTMVSVLVREALDARQVKAA